MKKINWHVEEAVALYALYFRYPKYTNISKDEMLELSEILKLRAKILNYNVSDKYRNLEGISKQLGNIHYVVTDGKEGLKNTSKIFYETFELYKKFPKIFDRILKEFYDKYNII